MAHIDRLYTNLARPPASREKDRRGWGRGYRYVHIGVYVFGHFIIAGATKSSQFYP